MLFFICSFFSSKLNNFLKINRLGIATERDTIARRQRNNVKYFLSVRMYYTIIFTYGCDISAVYV